MFIIVDGNLLSYRTVSYGRLCVTGKRQYKMWQMDCHGKKCGMVASRNKRSADLCNTAYINPNGSRAVFALAFDLDVGKANEQFCPDGHLDFDLVMSHLQLNIPDFYEQITCVTRTKGGGLHLWIGISPFTFDTGESKIKDFAMAMQSSIIEILINEGLGADPNARGLIRDFSNPKNKDNLLYENKGLIKILNRQRVSVLVSLKNFVTNYWLRTRLYNDSRVERKMANLFGYLTGELSFPELPARLHTDQTCEELTFEELRSTFGFSRDFLSKITSIDLPWLEIERVSRSVLSFRINYDVLNFRAISRRCAIVLDQKKASKKDSSRSWKAFDLCLPSDVCDGERNHWITTLLLNYKWAGLEFDEAVAKARLRIQHIPGFETSRNCKNIASIAVSVYKNYESLFGCLSQKVLPDWFVRDSFFFSLVQTETPGRGETPVEFESEKNESLPSQRSVPKSVDNEENSLPDFGSFDEWVGDHDYPVIDHTPEALERQLEAARRKRAKREAALPAKQPEPTVTKTRPVTPLRKPKVEKSSWDKLQDDLSESELDLVGLDMVEDMALMHWEEAEPDFRNERSDDECVEAICHGREKSEYLELPEKERRRLAHVKLLQAEQAKRLAAEKDMEENGMWSDY